MEAGCLRGRGKKHKRVLYCKEKNVVVCSDVSIYCELKKKHLIESTTGDELLTGWIHVKECVN